MENELSQIQAERKTRRRRKYTSSKLDKFTAELLELRRVGASLGDLQYYLKKRRVQVERSTILRWLNKHGK